MLKSIRTIRNIPRLKDISLILIKHGLGQLAGQLGVPLGIRMRTILQGRLGSPTSQVERLRLAFQELGPIFIKVGQMIANRPDLFSMEMVHEFAKLEDNVSEIPYVEIRELLQQELGRDPSEVFDEINEEPLAAGSIAQLHRAKLKDGTQVVLKVQRPGLEKIVDRDLEILGLVANALANLEDFRLFDPEGLVSEIKRSLDREINFSFERNALDRIGKSFAADQKFLKIPKSYPQYCTKRLLVMDYLKGQSIRKAEIPETKAKKLACDATRTMFLMIFRDGFFHADPHQSNLLYLEDGRLAFIDFGSTALFTKEMRRRLAKLLRALLDQDYSRLARQILKFGKPAGELSLAEFSQSLATRIDPYFGLSLHEIDVGELFSSVLEIARENEIRVPANLFMMARCLVLMESLANKLDPTFDAMDTLEPLVKRFALDMLNPDKLMVEVSDRVSEAAMALYEYPHYAGEVLRRMAEGRLQLDAHVQGVEGLSDRLDRSSNRISKALILSALLVSSSLIIESNHVLGSIGFAAAGLMGIWTFISIMRSA